MTEAEARALFLLAGFEVKEAHELVNQYWPDNPHYDEVRKANPWWLLETQHGNIKIGRRKRVVSISWHGDVEVHTEDDTTQGAGYIHAWTLPKAQEYLTSLRCQLAKAALTNELVKGVAE